ncbi:hypothetical protein D3C72_1109380 [compost metagenome]
MQHQGLTGAALGEHSTLHQFGRTLAAFVLVNLPAHGLAAVDVLDQIQVVILPAHRRLQVGNVPRPDLVALRCTVRGRRGVLVRRLAAAALMLLISGFQNAVKGRL